MSATPHVETHYYQLAHYNLGVTISLLVVNVLAVGLRFWARKRQNVRLQMDDWLTLPALILVIGASATMITSISKHAMGYEIPRPASQSKADLNLATRPVQITSQSEYAINLIGTLALGCIKLSFLFFYNRIFGVHKISSARFVIIGMMVFVGLWMVSFFFAHLFSCGTHFSAFWTSFESLHTKCTDTFKLEYAFCVTDFISDFIILAIPLPLVGRLQLQTSRKVAIMLVFLLGAGAVGASATRMAFTIKAIHNGYDVEDGDLVVTGVVSFMILELHLALLAACLPTIRFLFHGFSPESVISSIRSALSLHSLRSNHSRIDENRSNPNKTGENASTASDANVVAAESSKGAGEVERSDADHV